jgi:hypothetical protein
VGCRMLSSMGQAIDDLSWADLTNPDNESRNMNQWKLTSGGGAVQQPHFILTTTSKRLSDQKFDDIKSILEGKAIVARMEENCPLIDFAWPGNKVYQMTVSGKHSFDPKSLVDLLVQLGYLQQDGDKLGTVDANATAKVPLEYCWVVPYCKERDWKTKRPKTIKVGDHKQKEELQKCLTKHVHQYVLVMK